MIKRFLIFIIISTIGLSNEFSEGPYGSGYFDIAGPFELPDLNMTLQGDVNGDEIINILDVVQTINIILGSQESTSLADLNDDGIVNILDVVQLINIVLNP